MASLESKTIRHALASARERGFRSVRLRAGEARFQAELSTTFIEEVWENAEAMPDDEVVSKFSNIVSPVVGYFRPHEPLEIGRRVERGGVVAAVTALGLANDVVSPVDGEIVEVLAEPEQALEYGQPIARIRVGSFTE